MLGFEAKEGDEEAEGLVKRANDLFRHMMLDITSLDPQTIASIQKLIEFIEQRRIRLVFVEIKSQFRKNQRTPSGTKKIEFKPDQVTPDQYEEVGHSLLSIFQFLTRITNPPYQIENGKTYLIDLMNPDLEKRRQAFLSIRYLIKSFFNRSKDQKEQFDHEYCLFKIFWPIIDVEKEQENTRGIDINYVKDFSPKTAIIPLNYQDIIRNIIRRARKMFGEIDI